MSTGNRAAPPRISQRRQARLHAREQQRQRVMRKRQTRWALWLALVVVAVGGVAFFMARTVQSQPGQARPIQGQQHINEGESHVAYNSKPPTSGPHWMITGRAPVPWGIYKEPIADEAQLHNLEH